MPEVATMYVPFGGASTNALQEFSTTVSLPALTRLIGAEKVSVKRAPVIVSSLSFVNVMVNKDDPPTAMRDGENALNAVGGSEGAAWALCTRDAANRSAIFAGMLIFHRRNRMPRRAQAPAGRSRDVQMFINVSVFLDSGLVPAREACLPATGIPFECLLRSRLAKRTGMSAESSACSVTRRMQFNFWTQRVKQSGTKCP